VLAPGDPEECFYGSVLATNLAQRAQCPVILALDAVCHDNFTIPRFDLGSVSIDHGKRVTESDLAQMEEYRRYEVTEDGISPWAVPGTRDAMNLVTGNERDEWGRVTTEPKTRVRMVDKRSRKIETVRPLLPKAVEWGDSKAPVGILGVGILGGVITEAADRMAEQDHHFHCHRPRTLWPVLQDTIDFVNSHERVYVVEQSEGAQLAGLLKSEGARADKIVSILKYDGLQFSTAELVEAIMEKERLA
jgi:2-oxoglutarate ferredoxin oxidoreductase subunit alpha